jgi:chemotaxis protein methyltransferase CheR
MTPEDFSFLARLLRRRSGLSLTPAKIDLVERRLSPVMRRFGFRDLGGLVKELRLGREALAIAVTDAVTVNESFFFRDPEIFARFENWLLPKMLNQRKQDKRLRIWSAACAAGQEAYSIAMILDAAGLAAQGWSVDLIATDLSREAVSRAEEGRYDTLEMARGLNGEQRERWFRPSGDHWCIADPLRRMIDFRVFNLLDSFGWLDDLDFVFCRNVLIYFDRAHKLSVLDRIAETLSSEGALFLGEAEAPEAFTSAFVEAPGGEGIYFKNAAPLARIAAR